MISVPTLEWWAIAPELITSIAALLVLIVSVRQTPLAKNLTIGITLGAFVLAILVTCAQFSTTRYGAFSGQIDSDELANVGRILAAAAGIVATILAIRGRADDGRHAEFHALLLAAVAGMGIFVAAGSYVALFLGLELFSIALYVLSALDAERSSSLESGLKYLIVGGMSSAVLLYGTALIFGATGTLDIAVSGAFDGTRGALVWAGAALILGGLAFKVSAAPMHWWTVDVYEGAGTPITTFMSVATKAAAFIALTRVMTTGFVQESTTWIPIVAAIAVTSIVIGNVAALAQRHLKRMLGYSSIAQAGYMLIALVGWQHGGIPALVYALVVYAAMTLGIFAYVLMLERDLGRDATFADLAGRGWIGANESLLKALPPIAAALCALSLAGIPPIAGFFAKFGLFMAGVDAGYAWLAVVGALGSLVSLAYYLRIITELYMQKPDAARAEEYAQQLPANSVAHVIPAGTKTPAVASVVVVLGALTVLLAFIPSSIFDAGCEAQRELHPSKAACSPLTIKASE